MKEEQRRNLDNLSFKGNFLMRSGPFSGRFDVEAIRGGASTNDRTVLLWLSVLI